MPLRCNRIVFTLLPRKYRFYNRSDSELGGTAGFSVVWLLLPYNWYQCCAANVVALSLPVFSVSVRSTTSVSVTRNALPLSSPSGSTTTPPDMIPPMSGIESQSHVLFHWSISNNCYNGYNTCCVANWSISNWCVCHCWHQYDQISLHCHCPSSDPTVLLHLFTFPLVHSSFFTQQPASIYIFPTSTNNQPRFIFSGKPSLCASSHNCISQDQEDHLVPHQ